MYGLIRKALFAASPEAAHKLALDGLRLAHLSGATRLVCPLTSQPVKAMGLVFPNPVGIAAGMDKNGDYIDALGDLGFGFVEIGTVTPRPQSGNPKPRVFRIEQAGAMINRLGFNNKGVDHLIEQAKRRKFKGILGINIGKNASTPIENAVEDYLICFDKVYSVADYITVNISSPNTQNLRDLQNEAALEQLLGTLERRRQELAEKQDRYVPIAVKVAPDLDERGIESIARVVVKHQIDGVIATNTTLDRAGIEGLPHANEQGGLSGNPLRAKSDKVLASLKSVLPAGIALIGVGGISCGQDAVRKTDLGADLVQFYTGFVYRGPQLVQECLEAVKPERKKAASRP